MVKRSGFPLDCLYSLVKLGIVMHDMHGELYILPFLWQSAGNNLKRTFDISKCGFKPFQMFQNKIVHFDWF